MEFNINLIKENLPDEARKILAEAFDKANMIIERENERKHKRYPKRGDPYWTFQHNARGITHMRWCDEKIDKFLFDIGEVFKSEEEALFALERSRVRAELERLSNVKPSDFYQKFDPFYITYLEDEVVVRKISGDFVDGGIFYFKTPHDAVSAVNIIGQDRLKKYYFGM